MDTRAVGRTCYVHSSVIDAYLDGTMMTWVARRAGRPGARGRTKDGG